MLVVRHIVNHCRVKDILIAQHGILLLLLAQTCCRDVGGGTDNHRGTPVRVTLHDREIDREDMRLLTVFLNSMNLTRLTFQLLGDNVVKQDTQPFIILRIHIELDEVWRQGQGRQFSSRVNAGERSCGNV